MRLTRRRRRPSSLPAQLCRKLAESRRGPADQDESGEESPVVA